MALLNYFKSSLPIAKDTGISEIVMREANVASPQQRGHHKQKAYAVFSNDQREKYYWQYAAEVNKLKFIIMKRKYQAMKSHN